MTETHPYLASGIPGALFTLNFVAVPAGFFWQSKRFDDLEKVMSAKFET